MYTQVLKFFPKDESLWFKAVLQRLLPKWCGYFPQKAVILVVKRRE